MKRDAPLRKSLLAGAGLALLFLSCTTSPRQAAVPAPQRSRRAVLISFDGVSGTRLARLMREGKLPAYRGLAERGFSAERSQPPTPSLTTVSHITIATGALPRDTGIVSNTFLDRNKPFPSSISGFDAPIRAETLWQAARRQGKRVGVVLFAGADGKKPERSADWGMIYPERGIAPAHLDTTDQASWKAGDEKTPGSFSPSRSLTVSFGKTKHTVTFRALDETDDGRVDYDHLRVEPETGAGSDVAPGEWFSVEVSPEGGRTGAWCKLVSLVPDLSKTEIYVGGLYRNAAYPEDLRKTLDAEIGFWPGPPDHAVFGSRSVHPEVFLEQMERLSDFITRADLMAAARTDWDLLLLYQPEVDEVEHEFFLADPRQEGYTAERTAKFQSFVDRAYATADRALDRIERALSPGDTLFVTSDHGMTPIWTEILINQLLRDGGFVRMMPDNRVDPSSAAFAYTSGAIAHVYLGKGAGPETLAEIEKLLATFRIGEESPWDRVVRRRDAGPLGLDAPESGDLIVLARPGFGLSGRLRQGSPVGRPADLGMHGYVNAYADVDASFLCAGPGIARGKVERVRSWDIAARVSASLGIQPPRNAAR